MVLWVEHLVLGLPYLRVGEELRLCLLVFKQVWRIHCVFAFGIEARACRQGAADMLAYGVSLPVLGCYIDLGQGGGGRSPWKCSGPTLHSCHMSE